MLSNSENQNTNMEDNAQQEASREFCTTLHIENSYLVIVCHGYAFDVGASDTY